MNAPVVIDPPATAMLSAYRQLRAAERAFVDGYVADLQREADRTHGRISEVLHRAIPAAVVERSRGMLAKPLVIAAITERVADVARDTELSPGRLIREIMAVGFSNLGDYFTVGEDGSPRLDLNGLTRDQWAALSGMDVEMDPRNPFLVRNVKIRLHPKMDAIAKLGEYMALIRPDNTHWRGEQGRTVDQQSLPASTTVDQAGDMYSAMING